MALKPVDRLVAGYLVFATAAAVVRLGANATSMALVTVYALCAVLLLLFTRLREIESFGNVIHTLYPLLLLVPFYTAIGLINSQTDPAAIAANDAMIQNWELAIFGGQPSFELIRNYPSVVVSWIMHAAYFLYYPILVTGPAVLLVMGRSAGARRIIFGMTMAFVVCYVFFTLTPVAGPNWTLEHPTGAVRDVFPARLVYATLATGSAFGTAFPSSHVAATVATTVGAWCANPRLGRIFLVPCILLTAATVYTQMHYAIDASAGLAVGLAAGWATTRFEPS